MADLKYIIEDRPSSPQMDVNRPVEAGPKAPLSLTPFQGVGRGCGGGRGNCVPPALPSTNLILLGTVHGDPKGYERAWKLLDHFRPEIVTVEISPFSVRYRRRAEKGWQRLLEQALAELPSGAREHLALRRLAAQVALPFEVRVARDWSCGQGVPWRPVDLGAPARRHLPRYSQELLSAANLGALAACHPGSLEEFVEVEFRRATAALRWPAWRLSPQGSPETIRRERFLARRLRHLAAPGQRLVHLGGWEHLVPWRDGSGLGNLLADLQPLRLLLKEAEVLPNEQKINRLG